MPAWQHVQNAHLLIPEAEEPAAGLEVVVQQLQQECFV